MGVKNFYTNLSITSLMTMALAEIEQAAHSAISERNQFNIVLSGGETSKLLYRKLRELQTDWSLWRFWLGDERCVPLSDRQSNNRMIREEFLNFIPCQESQVFFIPAELGAISAARQYEKMLQDVSNFDLVLLGIGTDGHIASLFPGHFLGLGLGSPDVLPVFNAPKPPAERVTLSLQRLNKSSVVLIIAVGEGKKNVIDNFQNGLEIPALHIQGEQKVTILFAPHN